MSNVYKRYTIPVVRIGADGRQEEVDLLPVECHDHLRYPENDAVFTGSNIPSPAERMQGNKGVDVGRNVNADKVNQQTTSVPDQTFRPDMPAVSPKPPRGNGA